MIDSLGFVAAPLSLFLLSTLPALHHLPLVPMEKSRPSNPRLCPSHTNTQHVPKSLASHPSPGCRCSSNSRPWLFPDGMLNSYHLIIWVCPNHWLSPRLHLQSPTQLLSPTPTEVTWCTASHPSSVPPSFVCAVQRRSCSSAYVRQLWREPTEAQVLKWQSHLRSYRHFFPTSDMFQTGWDSYLITLSATPDMSAARLSVRRLVFIFRTPTVSLFSSVRGGSWQLPDTQGYISYISDLNLW